MFISWLVSWNNSFFLSQQFSLSRLFNTNIYYPYQNTLAYSDLMLVPSLLVLPVYYLTSNPLITVNVLLLLLLAGAATAMFLLARYLTKNTAAALLAGFLYAFSTYHLAQIGHIQLHTDMFLLLMLLFLHKWLDAKKPAYLGLAVFMILLEVLSSLYYAIYAGMLFVLFIGFFAARRELKLDRRNVVSIVVTLTLLIVVAFPFLQPYLQLHRSMPNFERSLEETALYSAHSMDYLATVPQNLLWGRWLGFSRPGVENILFPGLAAIILAVAGIVGIKRNLRAADKSAQIKIFYLLITVLSFSLSFGPITTFRGATIPLPFLSALKLMPGFSAMRVPARFGLLVLLGLCVLAAFGAARLSRLWRERRQTNKRADILAFIAVAIVVLQQVSWPIPLSQPIASGGRIPAIYKWLEKYPGADVVIELPPVQAEQIKYVYYSAYHSKQLVNGYSGYTPPLWAELEKTMASFPSVKSIARLRALGVDGIIVHADLIPGWDAKLKKLNKLNLMPIKKTKSDYFFSLRRPGARDNIRL